MSRASDAFTKTTNNITNSFEKYFFGQNWWVYLLIVLGFLFILALFSRGLTSPFK